MFSLNVKLLKERFSANPSRAFRGKLWNALDAALPPETRSERLHGVIRRTAIGFAIAIPVMLGGTSVYAYSSSSVTEGSVLYPMKRGIEVIQLRLVSSPEDVANMHLQMYERRLDEAEQLLDVREHMITTLNAAADEDDVVDALERMEAIDAMRRAEMLEHLQEMQARYEMMRSRVLIDEPSETSSLRTPSFILRRMEH